MYRRRRPVRAVAAMPADRIAGPIDPGSAVPDRHATGAVRSHRSRPRLL